MSLGFHVQYAPYQLPIMLSAVLPSMMLYFQPPTSLLHVPDITVGRIYYDNQDAMLVSDPVGLGHKMAEDSIASSRENEIPIWIGPNEPGVASGDAIARAVACEKERVARLNAVGLKACVFNFSVGWPRENVSIGKLETVPYDEFMTWLPSQNYVGFHEYWTKEGPLHPLNYNPERPSKVWRFSHWPYDCNILVTECGIDYQGQMTDGWQSHVPPGMNLEQWAQAYARQLTEYDNLVTNDDRVFGEAVYTVGPGFGWDSFDIAPFHQYFTPIFISGPVPEVPPVVIPSDEKVIRVKLKSGDVVILPVEEYLRGVVPAEVYPKWNMDALKAQAVWGRSVALARIEKPRSDSHDIDNRDQIYNSAKVCSRTDQAVRETEGVYIKKNGEVKYTYYVSDCGRVDCPQCLGQPGWTTTSNPDGVWPKRACQWGAQRLAKDGMGWRQISTYYYNDVQLSDESLLPTPVPPIIESPEESGMFNYKTYVDKFLQNPGTNDAAIMGVKINYVPGAEAQCIGVHVLTSEENAIGDHHIFLAVVDADGKRVPNAVINWKWEGMRDDETASPVYLDKPDNEPPGNIGMTWNMTVTVKVNGMISDSVSGLHIRHERVEEGQNRAGHWSYMIVWEVGGADIPVPPVVIPPIPVPPIIPTPGNIPPEIVQRAKDILADMTAFVGELETL